MGTLDQLQIVVTRPAGQAAAFANLLRAEGALPVLFPTIDIAALADCSELDAALRDAAGAVAGVDRRLAAGIDSRINRLDLIIFVSANAVEQAFARLAVLGLTLPPWMTVAATGPATAAQLRAHGIREVIHPSARHDSEGLIAEIDRLGLAPQRVLIVRGSGGREWLQECLVRRGASVRAVASYRRVRGKADPTTLLHLAASDLLAAWTVTSSEGGENLMVMLGPDARVVLNGAPMFAPHARIAARMRALGCTRVIETAGADAGLLEGLRHYFAKAPA